MPRRRSSTRNICSSRRTPRTPIRSSASSRGDRVAPLAMTTAYTVSIPQPEARRIEVELSLEARGARSLDVRLPVWTPGSYLVREHQRHVDGLSAQDESGRELPVEKIDKHTWRVSTGSARTVKASYRLHCFELT